MKEPLYVVTCPTEPADGTLRHMYAIGNGWTSNLAEAVILTAGEVAPVLKKARDRFPGFRSMLLSDAIKQAEKQAYEIGRLKATH